MHRESHARRLLALWKEKLLYDGVEVKTKLISYGCGTAMNASRIHQHKEQGTYEKIVQRPAKRICFKCNQKKTWLVPNPACADRTPCRSCSRPQKT